MSGPVVLVVDPVPQTAERTAQALAGTSFGVRVARDQGEAETVLASGDVAAVLAAMTFPRGNGYDLARVVRARAPEAAIYLVCGGFDVYNAERAAEVGVTGRIGRPFTVDGLRRHLEAVLGPLGEALSDTGRGDPGLARPTSGVRAAPAGFPPVAAAHRGEPDRGASSQAGAPRDRNLGETSAVEALPEVDAGGIEPLDSISGPFVRPLHSAPAEPAPEPQPAVADERLSAFLPRDFRAHPPVRVDPQVVAPAMERAILAILPEVVEVVINKAVATSPAFREMLELAVEEVVRQELPALARRVVRERLAEIEAGPKGSGEG